MDIMDKIRRRQALAPTTTDAAPPAHRPEMLYIGCIDARLDPIDDIGIDKGKALIFRNIGALVRRDERAGVMPGAPDSAAGEFPPNVSIGAALEFFLNHLPAEPGQRKHIVVSGHTDCGGIRACHHATFGAADHYLPRYLKSLQEVRDKVKTQAAAAGWDDAKTLQALERESVRRSMRNLMSYPLVRREVEAGRLALHGWVIDTATRRIAEMNPVTLEFEPMAVPPAGT